MKVGIIFGSKSDVDVMKGAADCLKKFGIEYSAHVLSAHRVPELLEETLEKFEKEDYGVIIAGAGLAAHLPGVIASKTILPVIGVPIKAAVEGLDALFSIVQMPKSIPVATVGVNGSLNAAILAAQIISLSDSEVKQKVMEYKAGLGSKIEKANRELAEIKYAFKTN